MKKARFLILIVAILLVAVCFVACQSTDDTTTETTTEPPVTTTLPALTAFESVKIAGNNLKDYTIVYAESPYASQAAANPDLFPVYDFDKESAERLSDLIFSVTGVRLALALDTETKPSDKEILVGETNRDVTEALKLNHIKTDDYVIQVSGSKLALCGGIHGTTWHAIDYLESLFAELLAARTAEYDFSSDYVYNGTYDILTITCIGDSITQGIGATNEKLFSYPAQLARFLWKDATVVNLGNSGKTMRNDLNDAYVNTSSYKNALLQAGKTDIFTIMLGTNDSRRDRNWNANSITQYKESCRLLFENLYAKNKDLKFVLANCPAYFGADGFGSLSVRILQKSLVKDMNDLGYPTTFFDMNAVTKTMRAYFPDKLHPNNMGHMLMAEAFAEALMAVINPSVEE